MADRWWSGRVAWRRMAVAGLAIALLGCSGGDGDDDDGAAAAVATSGTVVPEVVCVADEGGIGLVYFGYANDGAVPVALPVGPANRVTAGGGGVITTSQPEVFAPGTQGVVFWAALEEEGATATWTLTGDDGEAHAVTASLDPAGDAVACPGGVAPLDPPDDRAPELTASIEVTRDAGGAVVDATVEVSLAPLDEASRCPAGDHAWVADEPDVQLIGQGSLNAFEDGQPPHDSLSLTIDDPQSPIDDLQEVVGYSSISVVVDVEDRCHDAAGALYTAWAASAELQDLSLQSHRLCFGTVEGDGQQDVEVVDCALGPGLGLTGGYRVR